MHTKQNENIGLFEKFYISPFIKIRNEIYFSTAITRLEPRSEYLIPIGIQIIRYNTKIAKNSFIFYNIL